MSVETIRELCPEAEIRLTYGCGTYGDQEYPIIVLDRIIIPPNRRKQGVGTAIMKLLCRYADETKSVLMLSPSISLGATSIERLKRFYRKFGLKSNMGRTKIYQFPNYGMYRFPQ